MCLSTNEMNPKIAEENIPVWKVIGRDGLSPYYCEFKWKRGLNMAVDDGESEEPTEVVRESLFHSGLYFIESGWLHAFSNEQTAKNVFRQDFDETQYKLAKMYIPKGTHYYTGKYGGTENAVCAKQLYFPHRFMWLRKLFGIKEEIEI